MRDRRYSRYRRDEVFEVIAQQHELLPFDVLPDTATENSVNIRRYQDIHEKDRMHQQVAHGDGSALPPVEKTLVAGRSSRWYDHSLNISYYQHGITTIIAMHIDREDLRQLEAEEREGVNLIVTGHMPSDSIGINRIIDALEERGLEVVASSGLIKL